MVNVIALPTFGGGKKDWTECRFDPISPSNTNSMEGRRTESISFGTPYWVARYVPRPLLRHEYGVMDAFMMRAGGDGEMFLAHDAFRPRPVAHDHGAPLSGVRAGGGVFNGEATLQEIVNSRVIVISGLPQNFQLSPGDYVEVRQSIFVRSLHRVMATAMASPEGQVTLSIRHGLDTSIFNTQAVIDFERPSCLMQIDQGSYDGTKSWQNRSPSFSATEVFYS